MVQLVLPSILILSLASAAAAQTAPQPGPSPSFPVVVTSGEGLVKRTPDRAWLQVTAESRAKNPREAQKMNAELMAAVMAKLKGAGLPPDAIQTRGYSLLPEYDYPNNRQTLRGYLARNSVELRVDDLARAGELLEVAVNAGATSVGGLRFDLKDRTGAEADALKQAVQDARRRAEAVAAGAGMTVERVVRIEEHRGGVVPPPIPMMRTTAEFAADAAAPPIEPGEIEIRATVTLTAAVQ